MSSLPVYVDIFCVLHHNTYNCKESVPLFKKFKISYSRMTQRLRYDACIPKNLDDEVDSASSFRFVSLHQLVTKNQTLNFFVWIFVVVAIQKKRRGNRLASSLFKLQQ